MAECAGKPAEEDLVRRARGGDAEAFKVLWEEWSSLVEGRARALVPPSEVEGVVQEVWLAVWQGLPQFRFECKFRTWLWTITVNRCFMRLRVKEKDGWMVPIAEVIEERIGGRSFEEVCGSEKQSPHLKLIERELEEAFSRALSELPWAQRLAIRLGKIDGLFHHKIAQQTGWPLGTVKSHIQRGVRALARDQRLRALLGWAGGGSKPATSED